MRLRLLITSSVLVLGCRTDPPTTTTSTPVVVAPIVVAPIAPIVAASAVPVASASPAATAATETCASDADCILTTFPSCCSCCPCGPIRASTTTMEAARRDACKTKDCASCDSAKFTCVECKDPVKEGMVARCHHGVCNPVETSAAAMPPSVACKSDDDCWFDDKHQPIARPPKLRGKKIAPCKTGEHVPACSAGVCVVRAYKC